MLIYSQFFINTRWLRKEPVLFFWSATMNVVYLFCESSSVRIPYIRFDRALFLRLTAQGMVWDGVTRQNVFKEKKNAGWYRQLFSDIPFVWVDKTAFPPIRIFGFWEHPWDEKPESMSESERYPVPSLPKPQYSLLGPLPLPEKFPEHWRKKLEEEMRSSKYSLHTLRLYVHYNRLLCRTLQKPPEEIRQADIKQFLAYVEKDKDYSASSMNLAISAIKYFYNNVLKKDITREQNRPRHDKRLPVILSKEEISIMLDMEKNPKHRLLLMLAYSSGLRVSELVTLKMEHIDLPRRVINVRMGKGRKDRCTILSEKAACYIREYCSFYNIQTWLFPGQNTARHLSIRAAQNIFTNAVNRTGIAKKTSIHSLRHTFATHLLESGTDIRYIQTLLGHATLRTTERYTHIARRSLLRIQSPLDSI